MEYIKITEEIVWQAKDYVPMAEKRAFVDAVVSQCISMVSVTATIGEESTAMPPMYKEDSFGKARYLMGAFVKMYLRQEFVPVEGTEYQMAQDDYDRWAGGHLFNQIERLKRTDPQTKAKCFDLVQDYKALEKFLNAEIYAFLNIQNDFLVRLIAHVQSTTSPAGLAELMGDIETLQKQIEEYQNQTENEDDEVVS